MSRITDNTPTAVADPEACAGCGGDGRIIVTSSLDGNRYTETCPRCGGTGIDPTCESGDRFE